MTTSSLLYHIVTLRPLPQCVSTQHPCISFFITFSPKSDLLRNLFHIVIPSPFRPRTIFPFLPSLPKLYTISALCFPCLAFSCPCPPPLSVRRLCLSLCPLKQPALALPEVLVALRYASCHRRKKQGEPTATLLPSFRPPTPWASSFSADPIETIPSANHGNHMF